MTQYVPSSVPNDAPTGLKSWLATELRRVAGMFDPQPQLQIQVLGVEPAKPRNGMVVYADGVAWNPGSGEGFYGYQNNNWVKL